ncbi:LacI family transcriptional regulator [Halanaerobium saccharolyticum]|uniref:LacI family transcriptional regulator n=1 Tax=Halanaerobium saccharolyticum TaxID=43595 RepID=A0A4R6LTQ4_9FIRM|nr:LacI family DNA-binding transcriptional regulator [Halanaerobium saccharolyticum]TDO91326.1 LacI family transcriptional regulator [Halanaerobium saccharolyticum]
MVSINDVAEKANVSISTVSRVMNKNANVSKEKEKAVLAAVEELDYIPNGLARGLVTKNTNSVGILIADISNMYYSSLVKSIEGTLNQKGYYTIIGNTDWDSKRENDYLRYLIQKQVDGFILASTALDYETIDRFSRKGIPIIVLDREINSKRIDKIRINDYEGAYKATEHLIDCNYDYFVHLRGPENAATAIDRCRAFKQCLKDNGISSDKYEVLSGRFIEDKAREHISEFLARFELKGRRVGVFAANDATAFGILKEVKNKGLIIPDQVGVVGFDDVNFSSYTDPPLTTVNRPIKEIGKITANTLIERIEKKDEEIFYKKNITMDVKLIIRESTKKA